MVRRKALTLAENGVSPADFAQNVEVFARGACIVVGESDELLMRPEAMLAEIESAGRTFGDCDDTVLLTAALLESLGVKTRLRAMFPLQDGSMTHVWLEYLIGDRWLPMDITVPASVPRYPIGNSILYYVP